MTLRPQIVESVTSCHIPSAAVTVEPSPPRLIESAVLNKQKLLASEISVVRPRSVSEAVSAPSIVPNCERLRTLCFQVQNTMIHNSINLACSCDIWVLTQTIKMAVVNSHRLRCPSKSDTPMVSHFANCAFSKGEFG